MLYDFHIDGESPDAGQIFVFGSNEAGIHGRGAAKKALEYGAKYGIGYGLNGNSYAIPTKDKKIKTLPLEQISKNIKEFVRFTHTRPDLDFFITSVGCGLAGYQDYQIAPLFNGCYVNCSFPLNWKSFLKTL